jgi:hypothetical protein
MDPITGMGTPRKALLQRMQAYASSLIGFPAPGREPGAFSTSVSAFAQVVTDRIARSFFQ